MKRNDVFEFTAPNGVKAVAVVIDQVACEVGYKWAVQRLLCYSQNRLFTYENSQDIWNEEKTKQEFGKVIIDYCVLPEYDSLLENYYHQLDMANDYSSKEY